MHHHPYGTVTQSPTAAYIDTTGVGFNAQMGGVHPGVANFVMTDGSVRAVSNTTSVDVLRKLSDRRDGEVIGNF